MEVCLTLLEEEDDDDYETIVLAQSLECKRSVASDLFKNRCTEGYFNLLIKGHLDNDEERFQQFLRLNKEQFNFVLNVVYTDLKKYSTTTHEHPISPEEKLALTLRFLATGESYRSLAFAFRISHSYISRIVKAVLRALCQHLVPIFLPASNHEQLRMNASEFWRKWNFPQCVAAIDGKHIRMKCPRKSGSLFFNYKEYFSMVLLAMVDANYKFVAVDVGSYGKEGDSGIFAKSNMGKQVYSGNFFPPDEELPVLGKKMPFVIVGDEAFRLHKHLMKPYARITTRGDKGKQIFNYRLSRARRVSENAFGLLSQVFRVFLTPLAIDPQTCDHLVLTACCLHNLLRSGYLSTNKNCYEYDPNDQVSSGFVPLRPPGGFASSDGFEIRETFAQYFRNQGAVNWQESHVNRLHS